MNTKKLVQMFIATFAGMAMAHAQNTKNPLIDYEAFQKIVIQAHQERAGRLLTEEQFMQAMKEKDTILLDARSAGRYEQRHVTGAVSLPFTEFTVDSLAKIIPNKNTKVLIYCNNNFRGDPTAFAEKSVSAALNLSTYTSLKSYGYQNIYELGPLLDVSNAKLPFTGSLVK